MTRLEFKIVYRWLRMITGSQIAGTHGHLSDIVEKHNVTIHFLRELIEMRKPSKKIVYGKYTKEYLDEQEYRANCDSYYERMIGA